jgi:adenosine deaminase
MTEISKTNRFDSIPKVELHLHLEGAIPLPATWELIKKYGGDPSIPDMEALVKRFAYRDFPHFIETWIWKNTFIREYEDFTFIAEEIARDLATQNIVYVEAHYSPSGFADVGLGIREITRAIRKGLSRVEDTEVALIADFIRDLGPESAARTLAEAYEVKDLGVIGVGLGGSEHKYPPELFEKAYQKARNLGFHTTAHAGEAAGAESIWGALRTLKVERIGHGVRAYEDDALVDYLREHRIPLEMCPISNVKTGVVTNIEDHPVRRYFDRGLTIAIGTDDPKMFGNSLAEEYGTLVNVFGFSEGEIRELMLSSVSASWMPEEKKRRMTAQLPD